MKVNEDRHITEPEETSPTTSISRRAPKRAAVDQAKGLGELPGGKHIEGNRNWHKYYIWTVCGENLTKFAN